MLSELKITSSLSSNARLLTAGLLFILSSGANAGSAGTCSYSRYSPSADVSTKISHNRKLVEFDYMHPFLSGYDYLPFLDLKLKIDNYNSKEVNLGLAYRRNFDNKFILGSYVYFDHRNTGKDMSVSGVTVGSEFLSKYFDARANIYVPQNKRKKLNSSNKKSLEIKGHSIYLISQGDSYESAYKGYDAEIGVPLFGFSEELNEKFGTKIYAGKYSFTAKNVKPIKGTRFRLTHTLLDYYCCQDSYNVYLTAETQSDNVRRRQNFFGIGLKVLFNDRKNRYRRKPGSLNHRMMETIIRDVDIVTNSTAESVLSKKLYDGSNSKGGFGKLEVSKGTNFVGSSVTESEAQNLLPEIFSEQGIKKTIGEVEIYYVGDKEGVSDNIIIVDKGKVVVVDEKTQIKMDQRRREGFKNPYIKQATTTPVASIKPARRSSIIKANDLAQEIQRRKQKAIISRAAQQVAALVKQAERERLADAKAHKTQDEIDARARRLLASKAEKEVARQAKIKANQEKQERARLKREADAERERLANEALDAAKAASAKREQEEQARIEVEERLIEELRSGALEAAKAASAKREQEELRRQAEDESRKKAALAMQSRFRGHKGRIVADEARREKAAIQIQSIGRMKFAKTELKNRKVEAERQDAAVKLQAWGRKSAAQSEFKEAQKLAVESQKVVRGFLARKNQESQATNATKIQKIFRGWSANTKFNNDVKDIVTVQSLTRKWLAGKELARRQEAEQVRREDAAATQIQSIGRGFIEKTKFAKTKYGMTRLQALARKSAAQSEFKKAQDAANLIKGFADRVKFKKSVRSAVTAQSAVRKWLAGKELAKRQEEVKLARQERLHKLASLIKLAAKAELESQKEAKSQEDAASLVQRVFRGYLGRVVADDEAKRQRLAAEKRDAIGRKIEERDKERREAVQLRREEAAASSIRKLEESLSALEFDGYDSESDNEEVQKGVGEIDPMVSLLDSITKISRELEMVLAEEKLKGFINDIFARAREKKLQNQSATKIQALVGGYILRRAEERQKFGKGDVNKKPALDYDEHLLKQDVLEMDENSSFISMIEDLGSEEVYKEAYDFENFLYSRKAWDVDSDDESDEMLDFAEDTSFSQKTPASHGIQVEDFGSKVNFPSPVRGNGAAADFVNVNGDGIDDDFDAATDSVNTKRGVDRDDDPQTDVESDEE